MHFQIVFNIIDYFLSKTIYILVDNTVYSISFMIIEDAITIRAATNTTTYTATTIDIALTLWVYLNPVAPSNDAATMLVRTISISIL